VALPGSLLSHGFAAAAVLGGAVARGFTTEQDVAAVRDVAAWAADRKARLANDPAYKAAAVRYVAEQVWTACQPGAVAK